MLVVNPDAWREHFEVVFNWQELKCDDRYSAQVRKWTTKLIKHDASFSSVERLDTYCKLASIQTQQSPIHKYLETTVHVL